ncbi:hypothetical protein ACOMHN_020749 [Nucella lapillus]
MTSQEVVVKWSEAGHCGPGNDQRSESGGQFRAHSKGNVCSSENQAEQGSVAVWRMGEVHCGFVTALLAKSCEYHHFRPPQDLTFSRHNVGLCPLYFTRPKTLVKRLLSEYLGSFYNLDSTDYDRVNRYLSSLVEKALVELECSFCLEIAEDNVTITPLTLGRISSYYYLNHLTVRMFCDRLKADATIPDLIDVLSSAHEFADLPVRHNEDQINRDLATRLPVEVSPHSMDSSHTKTHLLLQAHFSQLPLPSTDYNTDTKSVLDQAIRILQAMLDVSADRGWLVTSLQVIQLLQMVVQGHWGHDSSLLTLPHLELYHLPSFRPQKSKGARPKGSVELPTAVECLPELMAVYDRSREFLHSALGDELDHNHIDQMCQVLERLPRIEVQMRLKGWWQGDSAESARSINIANNGGRRADSDWVQVHADQEYVLHLTLRRLNPHRTKRQDSKAYTPRFPKPKDEGWMVVVGHVEAQEVVALKRLRYVRGYTNTQLAMVTPETPGRIIYTLYLMSDCYLGLDQQYDLCLDVTPACLETQVNTELTTDVGDLALGGPQGGKASTSAE